ncbi:hypothetical protein E2K98_02390 [Bacillus salipaludis]|uniref:Core-binding (CB) domain-containing protein n=1 Tax=Bacillus salipaludis TaxID=2547811 RepID=A0A4R5VZT2_9BACI|nr:hypothetical protein [Bacillus salipaludis]TDK65108.1 hypothetical protein E2K98_02390 [Bacillus salipaludis]
MSYIPLMKRSKFSIRAKKEKGLRLGTINGYQEVMRYFRQLLSGDVMDVIETTADKIRSYIKYLRTERIPYSEDEHRKRSNKELSVHMINIRIRALSTFRFLFTEKMITLGGGLTFEEALSKEIMIFFTEWNVYMTKDRSLSNTPF